MKRTKRHHAGTVERSDRLGSVLESLQDGQATTLDLQLASNDMAPATTVADLRKLGHKIECRYEGLTDHGRRIYSYTLVGR